MPEHRSKPAQKESDMPLGMPLPVFDREPVDEAALLSAAAYHPLPANLSGWSIIPFPDTKDSYYAHHSSPSGNPGITSDDSVAFAAIKGDTVAIALRGTVLTQLTGDLGAAADHPKVHYNNVLPFIRAFSLRLSVS
jgi:hypothetical protein